MGERLQYAAVETALARLTGRENDQQRAFRGIIKQLRKFGVPSIAFEGTGKKASYDLHAIGEMALALTLIEIGLSPRRACDIVLRKKVNKQIFGGAWFLLCTRSDVSVLNGRSLSVVAAAVTDLQELWRVTRLALKRSGCGNG